MTVRTALPEVAGRRATALCTAAVLGFLAACGVGDDDKAVREDPRAARDASQAIDWIPLTATTWTYDVEIGDRRPMYARQAAWPVAGAQAVKTERGLLGDVEPGQRGLLVLRLEPVDAATLGLPETVTARAAARLHVERDDVGVYVSRWGSPTVDPAQSAAGLDVEASIVWLAYALRDQRGTDAVAELAFVPQLSSGAPTDVVDDGVMGRVLVAYDPEKAHGALLPEDRRQAWDIRPGTGDRPECRANGTCLALVRSVRREGMRSSSWEAFIERFWFKRNVGLVYYEQTIHGKLAMRWTLRETGSPTP
jgi:hypothetical protein